MATNRWILLSALALTMLVSSTPGLHAATAETLPDMINPTDPNGENIEPALNYSFYVATETMERFTFTAHKRLKAAMIMDIDNTVPLDVVVLPGKWTDEEYTNLLSAIGYEEAQVLIEKTLGKGARMTPPDPNMLTSADIFTMPLSKKGAYVHWESGWQALDEGTYTVFLDNQGNFSPTRGDAPVRLLIYSAPGE
ncbi:hypothetical protein [Pseudomonas fluorescens]|uniref:Uncharacterized protein n=1 Tax=Pseudomonas fluorescens TaxID=294 RepID=A0A5E7VLP6_PSEFL|nr:hypothetical protein [Pseudomonas fluorescens]VVQ23668.1 hypothetical protein PS928_05582 [Pseudomonas fluorescens]